MEILYSSKKLEQKIFDDFVREGDYKSNNMLKNREWNDYWSNIDIKRERKARKLKERERHERGEYNKKLALRLFKTLLPNAFTLETVRAYLTARVESWEYHLELEMDAIRDRDRG